MQCARLIDRTCAIGIETIIEQLLLVSCYFTGVVCGRHLDILRYDSQRQKVIVILPCVSFVNSDFWEERRRT